MRSMQSFVVAALAFSSLVGCGPAGQPRIFRVAVDVTPVKTLNDPQCFKGNMPNQNVIISEQFYRKEAIWVVWDGPDKKQYLDMGTQTSFTLGDSPTIVVDNLIEGAADGATSVFHANKQEQRRDRTIQLRTTDIVTTFDDLGATPMGTIVLNAQFQCQDGQDRCPNEPEQRSCKTQLNFWARRVEVTQTTGYPADGTSISQSTR